MAEELRDLASRARTYADGVVVDDRRLAAVDERLEVVERASRRHGGTLAGTLEALAAAETLLAGADEAGEATLVAEVDVCERAATAAVTALSQLRTSAARRLESAVVAQLRRLRLRHARFRVVLETRPDDGGLMLGDRRVAAGSEGADEVDFRLATTPDGVPIPLDQGPSGGELSRLALALRAVVALSDDCPTLVVDEVDAGLGGETAARVGEALAGIAGGRQVVVVTHRAEIASRAATHLLVERGDRDGRARSSVRAVDGEERVAEVARLMSGRRTEAALARARELLDEGAAGSPRRTAATIAPG
jgi:DNA repair protein RecN (Recombination protein N)